MTPERITGRLIVGLWHGFNRSGVKTLHGFVSVEGMNRVMHAELSDATGDLESARRDDILEIEVERTVGRELYISAARIVPKQQ